MTKYLIAIIATLVVVAIGLSLGAVRVPLSELALCLIDDCDNQTTSLILWELRLPRVLMALVAGGGLAVAGALLQNSTNNELADPYLFGLVSGAGLGAVVYSVSGLEFGYYGTSLFAALGALFAIFMVMAVILKSGLRKPEHLILAGVAVSFMLAACMHFILFIVEPLAANRIIFWLMGSVASVDLTGVIIVTIVISLLSVLVLLMRHHIDALMLGDDQARSLGVNVSVIRFLLLVFTALITAVIVAFCGGIGFVGLMIPHIVRRFGVSGVARLLPLCFVVGGMFLVLVDLVARTAITNQEMPLGVITSALGSLFFLLVLKQGRK